MDIRNKPRARHLREDFVEGLRECWVVTSGYGVGFAPSLEKAYASWEEACGLPKKFPGWFPAGAIVTQPGVRK